MLYFFIVKTSKILIYNFSKILYNLQKTKVLLDSIVTSIQPANFIVSSFFTALLAKQQSQNHQHNNHNKPIQR